MTHKRIACALIPDFSLAVHARENPTLHRQPVALADGPMETANVVAVNRKAREAGVTTAMTVSQAGSICPGLIVKRQDTDKEKALSKEVLNILYRLSPFVEENEPGLYYLDASGLDLLYKDEQLFAKKIDKTVRSCRYPIRVGIASGKFVAHVAAATGKKRSATIVPTGQERPFLAPLTVDHLPLSEDTFEKFDALGLRTISQLMAFPPHDMIERFATEGVVLAHLLRGEDTDFFQPENIDEHISEEMHLTYSINSTLAIAYHLGQLLEKPLALLERTGLGCRRIDVKLFLDDSTDKTVTVTFDRLTASLDKFIRQFKQAMEKVTLLSPTCGLKVTLVDIDEIFAEQLQLRRDGGGQNSKKKPDLLNDKSISRPSLHPSFLPEQYYRLSPAQEKRKKSQQAPDSFAWNHPYCMNMIDGLRLLPQPHRVNVTTDNGQMTAIAPGHNRQHPVRQFTGPWRLSGHWWNGSYDRLYYEVETNDRRMYLMFYDRTRSQWYMQGMFD